MATTELTEAPGCRAALVAWDWLTPFAAEFALEELRCWIRHHGWTTPTGCVPTEVAEERRLEGILQDGHVVVGMRSTDGRPVLWLPLPELTEVAGVLEVAAPIAATEGWDWSGRALGRALEQHCRLIDSTGHLGSYVDRISMSYEELTFLRQLSDYIRLCQVDQDVEAVAAAMLPSMREVAGAAGALFVVREESASLENGWYIATADGETRLAEAAFDWLLRRHTDEITQGPVIRNNLDRTGDGPEGLRSCLSVPVEYGEVHVGWLVCLDKLDHGCQFEFSAREDEFTAAEVEFGTYEATLISSVATTLATHARNFAMFRDKERLLISVIRTLVNTLDARDAYTCGHSERVASIARRLAEHLGLSATDCERIYVTGLLHDIGKIGVPDEVLRKAGQLSDEEFATIKTHPEVGHAILKDLKPLDFVLPGVLHHHERVDGLGYPHRLSGPEIPLAARILAVADSFDAMTSNRPYRQGMPVAKAEAILRDNVGRQWDADIVAAFLEVQDDIYRICGLDEPPSS